MRYVSSSSSSPLHPSFVHSFIHHHHLSLSFFLSLSLSLSLFQFPCPQWSWDKIIVIFLLLFPLWRWTRSHSLSLHWFKYHHKSHCTHSHSSFMSKEWNPLCCKNEQHYFWTALPWNAMNMHDPYINVLKEQPCCSSCMQKTKRNLKSSANEMCNLITISLSEITIMMLLTVYVVCICIKSTAAIVSVSFSSSPAVVDSGEYGEGDIYFSFF